MKPENKTYMIPENNYLCYFSPTGTSRRVAEAVGRGLKAKQTIVCDATHDAAAFEAAQSDIAVFAVPVYGGHAAPEALKRLGAVRGAGTPAVVIVLYGNRAYDAAARELAAFVTERGFVPVAAAAFVGEHSYSTARWPIASGRPDDTDCAEAEAFGREVAAKVAEGIRGVDVQRLPSVRSGVRATWRFIRFVVGYRCRRNEHPAAVETAAERCTHCGRCAALCPMGAIAAGSEERTDAARCIRCCACVKGCPTGARSYDSPFAPALSRNFAQQKPNQTLI